MAHDFVARILRDDAEASLGAGQRCFDVEIFLDAAFVRENTSHLLGGKYVAKNTGAHADGGH